MADDIKIKSVEVENEGNFEDFLEKTKSEIEEKATDLVSPPEDTVSSSQGSDQYTPNEPTSSEDRGNYGNNLPTASSPVEPIGQNRIGQAGGQADSAKDSNIGQQTVADKENPKMSDRGVSQINTTENEGSQSLADNTTSEQQEADDQEEEIPDIDEKDSQPENENGPSEDTNKGNTANENEAAEPEGAGEVAGETGAEGAGEAGAEAGAEAGTEAGAGAELGATAGAEAGVAGAEGAVAAEAGAAGIAGAEAAGAGAVAGAAAAEGAVAGAAAGAGATAGVAVAWPVIVIIIIVLIIALVIFIIVGYFLPRTHTDKTNPDDMTAITQVEDSASSGKITFSNPDDLSKISAGKIGPASVWMMSSLSKAHESIKINYGNTNYDESTPGVTNQNEPYEFDVESVDSIKCVDTKSKTTLSPIPISLKSDFDWGALIKPEYTDQVQCAVGYYPGQDTPIIGAFSSRFGPGIFPITGLAQAGRKAAREKTAEIVSEAIDANKKINEDRPTNDQIDITPARIDVSSVDSAVIDALKEKIDKTFLAGTDGGVFAKDTLPKGVHISFM